MKAYNLMDDDGKYMLGIVISSTEPYQLEFIHNNPKQTKMLKIADSLKLIVALYLNLDFSGSDPVLSQRAFDSIKDLLPESCAVHQLVYEQETFYLLVPPILAKGKEYTSKQDFMADFKNVPACFRRNSRHNSVWVTEEFRQRILAGKFTGFDFRLEYSDEKTV